MATTNVVAMPQSRRRIRSPRHTWHLRHRPFVIQPCAFAPVRAGETLKNLSWQSRVVSDPIRNPLIGWWLEYYWFYAGMSQFANQDNLEVLWNPNYTPTAPWEVGTALEKYLVSSAAVNAAEGLQANFLSSMYYQVVWSWFRGEGELPEDAASGALYRAQRVGKDVWDSLQPSGNLTVADPTLVVGADDTITGSEVDQLMRDWELSSASGLTDMSYEDYLAAQGVKAPQTTPVNAGKPELIRRTREWTYPANTVDPVTGTPSSAVSWSIAERADKDRFFSEPGFVLGLTVARPKIYLSSQNGSMSGFLNNAFKWLPKQLLGDVEAALHKVTVANPVVDNTTEQLIDLRDLYEHGEQFLNLSPDTAPATYGFNQCITTDREGLGRYPREADVNQFFKTSTINNVRQDGSADFRIATDLPPDALVGVDSDL